MLSGESEDEDEDEDDNDDDDDNEEENGQGVRGLASLSAHVHCQQLCVHVSLFKSHRGCNKYA